MIHGSIPTAAPASNQVTCRSGEVVWKALGRSDRWGGGRSAAFLIERGDNVIMIDDGGGRLTETERLRPFSRKVLGALGWILERPWSLGTSLGHWKELAASRSALVLCSLYNRLTYEFINIHKM